MKSSNNKTTHQQDDSPANLAALKREYEAAVIASIERGLNEADNGQLITQDDIEKEFVLIR